MSRTKIDWATDVINPITGCNNNCEYCYARRFAQRLKGRFGYPADEPFRPTFHEDKLWEVQNLKGNGKRIFLDSMGDWFSRGVDMDWLDDIIEAIENPIDCFSENIFLVLTKRPGMIPYYLDPRQIPENLWMGVSVDKQENVRRINHLKRVLPDAHKFVSFEPLHGPIQADLTGIEWVICGAETGNRKGKIEPDPKWIDGLLYDIQIEYKIPVFMKNNLAPYICSDCCLVQEFPEAMKR